MMFGQITQCASCGAALEVPCDPRDPDADGWRGHCSACNERFDAAMAIEFPFGQCRTCGGAYSPCTIECERCEGEGELIVLDGDGYQYAACGRCGGSGERVILSAMHEETLCGFPDGEGRWQERATHVEILAQLRADRDDRAAREAAAAAWRANLSGYTATIAGGDDVDDLPF